MAISWLLHQQLLETAISPAYILDVRKRFSNLLILAGGQTADSAAFNLQAGLADLIAFGRLFIANPDLVERFRFNAPLAEGDKDTFYQGGDSGYIDYPAIYQDNVLCNNVLE